MDCSTREQPGECELIQQHCRLYDPFGGLGAFDRYLQEMGIETSSLVKYGMPLKEWCNNYTVQPLDAIGLEMAECVNGMTRNIKALTAGEGSSLGQKLFKAFQYVWDNRMRFFEDGVFSETYQAVQEYKTLFPKAYQAVLQSMTWFSKAYQAVLQNNPWLSAAFQAVLQNNPWLSAAFQIMMRNVTPSRLMAFVIALRLWKAWWAAKRTVLNQGGTEDKDDGDGVVVAPEERAAAVLWKGRRAGERNVLNPGGIKNGDGDDVDGPETDAGVDGGNNGHQDSEQLSPAMCLVTFDGLSDAYRTANALTQPVWGHLFHNGSNRSVAPDGQVQYRIHFTSTKKNDWFRADQVDFGVGDAFNRHDLRKRV